MVIVGHLVSFIMGKCQRQMRSAWITPASVWSSRRRNGNKNARRRGGERQGPACANGGKLPTVSVEMIKPREKRDKKCPPARRGTAGASMQTEAKSPPSQSRRPSWRGNRKKNARRRGKDRQGPACTRKQIARRHRRDVQAGGETG